MEALSSKQIFAYLGGAVTLLAALGFPSVYSMITSYSDWKRKVDASVEVCTPDFVRDMQIERDANRAKWTDYQLTWADEIAAQKAEKFCKANPEVEFCVGD